VADEVRYEIKLANGDVEVADSLWGARHIVARRAAFAPDPLRPRASCRPRSPRSESSTSAAAGDDEHRRRGRTAPR